MLLLWYDDLRLYWYYNTTLKNVLRHICDAFSIVDHRRSHIECKDLNERPGWKTCQDQNKMRTIGHQANKIKMRYLPTNIALLLLRTKNYHQKKESFTYYCYCSKPSWILSTCYSSLSTVFENVSRCVKITEKISFNIASEASNVYILSGQKLIKNAKNGPLWRVFENLKLAVKQCYQTGQF